MLNGVDLVGDGTVSDLLWARPALTILGIDAPPVVGSSAALESTARARLNLRVPPGIDAKQAQDALVAHLEAVAPWHAEVDIEREADGQPFTASIDGPAYAALTDAMEEAYGRETMTLGQGGSIPLCVVLQETYPDAEIMLIGVEEPRCLIHAPNESVEPSEIENMAVTEAMFLERYATRKAQPSHRRLNAWRTRLGRHSPASSRQFLVHLGAALNAVGDPVYSIQERLRRVAIAYGVTDARISAFPTSMLVSLGGGEPATLEPTMRLDGLARLDQISALDRLVDDVEEHTPAPADALQRLHEILGLAPRFGPLSSIGGYAALTVGIALILHPALRDVAAAAVFGAIVGVLRLVAGRTPTLRMLLPMIAAFSVSALTALAVEHHLADPGLRAMIAALVVFLPGAALTTSVMELSAGDMIAGSSRLVWAGVQLALLAFGILAGVGAVGLPSSRAFSSAEPLLGAWAPWVGVFIYAIGTFVAHSAPRRSLGGLLVVLYAAWLGQVVGRPGLRRLRQRVRRRAGNDAGGCARGALSVGHARPCVVPPRVLAAGTGSA